MARKVELGAGVAAAVLSVLTLAVLLAAPVVAVCPGQIKADGTCSTNVRFITLLSAGQQVHPSTWYFIIAMAMVTLAGGIGAALHVLIGLKTGVLLLWPAAILTFAGCALTGLAGGVLSLFFLPPVLALCVAAYAGLVVRRRRPDTHGDTGESPPTQNGSRYFGRGELS